MPMHVTILGSGTNLHPTRAAAGYLVETDHAFLLDFGPRTLSNLLKTGFDRHQLRYLLFTHYHADHFSDFIPFFFDAVCHSQFVAPRADLTIIGPPGTKRLFGTILRTFPNFHDAPFAVTLREITTRPWWLGKTKITPLPMVHTERQICIGYRIDYEGRTLAYSGDACFAPVLVRLCHRAHVAVLDCSFPQEHPGVGHMHAGECGKVANDAQVQRLILSHFYPIAERYDVAAQARQAFSGTIDCARDLMRITV